MDTRQRDPFRRNGVITQGVTNLLSSSAIIDPRSVNFPFRGRGFYDIRGKVVEDFGIATRDVTWLANLPFIKRAEIHGRHPSEHSGPINRPLYTGWHNIFIHMTTFQSR